MKQQTMVAMITTKRRMEEAMPAKVVGLQGGKKEKVQNSTCFLFFSFFFSPLFTSITAILPRMPSSKGSITQRTPCLKSHSPSHSSHLPLGLNKLKFVRAVLNGFRGCGEKKLLCCGLSGTSSLSLALSGFPTGDSAYKQH